MKNLLLVTTKPVGEAGLIALIERRGGVWNADVGVHQGVIEAGDAVVYVGLANLVDEYSPAELAALHARLGSEPHAIVDIHIGHGAGSEQLAMRIAEDIIGEWGGMMEET